MELIRLLKCKKINYRLRFNNKKGVSGVIFCDNEIFPIKYSIPILIYGEDRTRFRKLRAAYESMGFAPWKANQSDWIKHMRIQHIKGLKIIAEKIKKLDNPRILVLGCGWGWEIWTLRKLIDKEDALIVGLDLTRKPLIVGKLLRNKFDASNVVFAVGLSDKLPFKKKTFDVAIAIFGPLDHTERYEFAFRDISRILKNNGYFFFTVLNRFSLDWIFRNLKSPKLYFRTLKKAKEKFVRVTLPSKRRAYRLKTHYYDCFEVKKLLSKNNMKALNSWSIFSILSANFRDKRFTLLDKLRSKIELLISDKPLVRCLGRYIAVVAEKQVKNKN